MPKAERRPHASLEEKVEVCERALHDALEQQNAISEILRVMAASPSDVRPVLHAVAEHAARLCDAPFARVMVSDGALLHPMADYSAEPIFGGNPVPLARTSITGRAVLERATVHFPDVAAVAATEFPDATENIERLGCRAVLGVPLLREAGANGAIFLFRREPGPFSSEQIALVQTFAQQAAIAIENVRLFHETKEALERQTAMSEILRVISRSPTNVQPVFEIIAERALNLCGAGVSVVSRVEGGEVRLASVHGVTHEGRAALDEIYPLPVGANTVTTRAIRERRVVQVEDVLADPTYYARNAATVARFRGSLCAPMLREGDVIGAIYVGQREPARFTDSQVELLRTFADQAVIAVENVRLLNETKEALERQTAMSEILRVISRSPTNVQPVLDTIATASLGLCDSVSALVFTFDGELIHLAANANLNPEDEQAWRAAFPRPPSRDTATARAILTGSTVMIPDVLADPEYAVGEMAVKTGFRSALGVPLIRDGKTIGAIGVGRSVPGAFHDNEIALLRTFADQAVIAIENVRLFNETQEGLAQQTAIAGVLKVISQSAFDLQRVLKTLVETATRLCDASHGFVFRPDADVYRLAVAYGASPEFEAHIARIAVRPERGYLVGRTVQERRPVQILDATEDPDYRDAESQRLGGYRTMLGVPMLNGDEVVGVIVVWRTEVRAFSGKQIDLLTTFADQAAIAIENTRLFNETKEALDRQTAMSEILRAISNNPTDVQPVFDIIGEHTLKLCDAAVSFVSVLDGDVIRLGAYRGLRPEGRAAVGRAFPMRLDARTITARAVRERRIVQVEDVLSDPEYETADVAKMGGFRGSLAVPMLRKGKVIGAIFVAHRDPGRFTQAQVELLKTFGDQAAIAIQNVRLLNETKEALERQTATAEVLRVISGSPTELRPVFESIAERAAVLSSARYVYVTTFDGELIHMGAAYGPGAEAHRKHYPMKPSVGTLAGRVVLHGTSVEIADMLADPAYEQKESAVNIGFRSALGVPMIREGHIIGCIVVARAEAGSFAAKVEELLKTFADQAVIAIENARLFNETKEALEQQTAIAEILRVISGSPTDVQPVLDAIAERAAKLCDASASSMYLIEAGALRHLASKGPSPDPVTHVETLPINGETITGRAVLERRTIQVEDLFAAGNAYPLSREIAQRHGHRTVVVTPLLREGQPFGAILLRRNDVRAFSDREIALLRTFGDQAAIALENVRLFNETKEALEQQRASGEVLAAISSSIADTRPVFEKILASCERLFAGRVAGVSLVGDDGLVHLVAYQGPHRDELEDMFPLPLDASGSGLAILTRSIIHYPDVEHDANVPERTRSACIAVGYKAVIFAPMLWEGKAIGVIFVGRDRSGAFSVKEIALLRTFADQAVIAIQNARLFHEIEDKSRELEVANKHKSEFLANMSHELRTPLNAIIGFSEVLLERLFGELNDKQDDYLKDIHSSGKHLLSLINDILDLSKIEAGRMELEPSDVDVAAAIAKALSLVRERAQHHGIALAQDVDAALEVIVADERKFRQILLNLLSNAVKFTPDGGRIDVTARRVDGVAEIAVRDTGIGIAPEDQAAVFEAFRQVGSDYTRKQEGTGLGLALTRRFVELHGGRIRLDSEPGRGSTFTFTIPLVGATTGESEEARG